LRVARAGCRQPGKGQHPFDAVLQCRLHVVSSFFSDEEPLYKLWKRFHNRMETLPNLYENYTTIVLRVNRDAQRCVV
jgi:hypothetical protein